MSKEQLCAVNKKLLEHLKENEKYNAFYYEPVNNVYWCIRRSKKDAGALKRGHSAS